MHIHDLELDAHMELQSILNGQNSSFDEIPLMIYFVGTQPFPLATLFRRFVTRGYKEFEIRRYGKQRNRLHVRLIPKSS